MSYKKRKGFENAIKRLCKERKLDCKFENLANLERAVIIIEKLPNTWSRIALIGGIVWGGKHLHWVAEAQKIHEGQDGPGLKVTNCSKRCETPFKLLEVLADYKRTRDFEQAVGNLKHEQA